jgi:glycosyltransferase involved in cell wall biosynthesis
VTSDSLSVLLVGDYPADPTLGSSKVLFKLQEHLRELGHSCEIVFGEEIGGPRYRQLRQLVAPWRAGHAVARRVANRRVDVVDVASAEGLWIGTLRRMGSYRRTVYVCRSNGLEHLNYRRMLDDAREGLTAKPWTRRIWYPASRLSQVAVAARLADAMIVLNDRDRQFVLDRGWQPADRVTVVPHGVSDRFLNDDPGAGAPRGAGLLFCGSWDRAKGIDYLVSAFEQMHAAGRREHLTIVGPGVPAENVAGTFNARVRPFVTVVPRVSEDQVMAAYRAHDVLLWPSTYEGFGLVLLEAMTQRLPAVAAPAGCASSLIEDGRTGVIVPARDAGAIAAAAARLMDDPAARVRVADQARRAVASFSWTAAAASTVSVYRCALASLES